jgi:hypothetical protein
MLDLNKYYYDRTTLKKHIYEISLWDILKTQKIDEGFAAKYILNKNYQLTESEKKIDIEDVLFNQPHLNKMKLLYHLYKYTDDNDSVDKFDTYQ